MTIDPITFRRAVGSFASSITIITVPSADGFQGMTATAFCSLSLNPALILICLDRMSRTASGLSTSKDFSINILGSDQASLSQTFSTRSDERRLDGIAYDVSPSGLPVFQEAVAYLECRCVDLLDGGDHVIVIGEVRDAVIRDQVEPLMYFRGGYRHLAAIAD